ncbi:MAG: hypothetical protein JWM24_181 [Solirubrobacterales bacterium]|nr:hypothetical protein [Solirubrobacterales bacterium]
MASVHDVAKYILGKRGSMSTWKLQKLVYYSQAWHLVWRDDPLFADQIEAWANGPVVRALYDRHRGRFSIDDWAIGDAESLGDGERKSIDAVLTAYGDLSGRQLSFLTHSESPWRDARGDLPPTERADVEISQSSMQAFYSALDTDENATPVEEIDW